MELDKEYRIIYEDSNVVLQFYKQKTRVKKSGLEESYEFTDNFYYPTLKHALKSYLNKSLKGSKTIELVLERINTVENNINQVNK